MYVSPPHLKVSGACVHRKILKYPVIPVVDIVADHKKFPFQSSRPQNQLEVAKLQSEDVIPKTDLTRAATEGKGRADDAGS